MTVFEKSAVDWTKWARHADPRACEACGREFQPNHPRRRFCGREDCPGRQRRRVTGAPRRRRAAPRRERTGLPGVMAEVLLEVQASEPQGTKTELAAAVRDLAQCGNSPVPGVERALVMRILCVAAVRAAALTTGQEAP